MRRWLYCMISLAALGSFGNWALGETRSARDRSEVAHMTDTMKTVCVGRYLIDLPSQAEVSLTHERIRATKLRSKKRSINSLDGEELVERLWEFNFTTTYTLSWETRGVENKVFLPFMPLEAQAGSHPRPCSPPPGSSLHEDAVLVLWDSIASSIRPNSRPTDPRSPVAP